MTETAKKRKRSDCSTRVEENFTESAPQGDNLNKELAVAKRNRYTFEEKKKILEECKTLNARELCVKYGLNKSLLSKWRSNEEIIKNAAKTSHTKTLKKVSETNELDTELLTWLSGCRCKGISVSGPMICRQALVINSRIGGPENFKASHGWLEKWKRRTYIKNVKITGSNRRERSWEKKSINRSGADGVYESDWFDFPSDNNDTGNTQEGGTQNAQSQHSVPTESTPFIKIENTSTSSDEAATSNKQSENSQVHDEVAQQPPQSPIEPAPSPQQPPWKRERTLETNANGNDSVDSVLNETFEIPEKFSFSMKDSCVAFVNHIAQELRKYDHYTLSCVKNAINNIIYEADMGKYQMCRPRYDTQQYQQLPGCSTGSTSTLPPPPFGENLQVTPAQESDFIFDTSCIN